MHIMQYCFGWVNFKFRFFSGKIVTSLADIFTMEEALFKNIFGIKILFVNRFSKFLWYFFRLLQF